MNITDELRNEDIEHMVLDLAVVKKELMDT